MGGLAIFLVVAIVIILLFVISYSIWGIIAFILNVTNSKDLIFGMFPNEVRQGTSYTLFYIFGFLIYIFGLIIMFLLVIFIIWLIIKHVIPCVFWILFIPIPIRSILLAIPPFPELTDAGVLPFMERLLNIFTSSERFVNKLGISSRATGSFLITASRYVIKTFVPNYNPDKYYDSSNDPSEKYASKPDGCTGCGGGNGGNSGDQDEDTKKYNEQKKNASDFYINSIIMIENEKANCIRKNTKETTPNMSFIEKTQIQAANAKVTTQCTVKSLSGYFKAQISQ